jgi:flagellar basal-body rod protein FlgF
MQNAALVSLSRLSVLERQFDVVANNIANLNTAGFKSSSPIFQEFLSSGAEEDEFAPTDAAPVQFVHDPMTVVDWGVGPIQQTGNPLDIAIDGDAFIAVQTTAGERYTRNGALKINTDGTLVTADGTPIAGDNGPIVFQTNDRNVAISADGRVSVVDGAGSVDTLRGKLKLVSFTDRQQLAPEGASLFSAPAGVVPQPATKVRVIQSAIEGSNVNGVVQMSRMIELNRTYALVASLLKSQGDQSTQSIDKLAQVPS